ncbi:alanine racemase [Jeotgalibacillus sp. R-1-5s-1]|uniref:alanine racemase n=1 Tax=Jeotgalibacillus sp. R-1-5s-1 TaxID=2555897 RepID=UPI00106C4CEC|nr:alanine racemase [Jeotgalibacillus sp. R-1-5s-1]TFD95315.1 alanine racemase [Jeotgalibacillus sp. R-1-5s-1]
MKDFHRDTWIEVDLDAITHNVKQISKHIGEEQVVMAVVKANAYGHGYVEVAKAALEAGATWLAVAFLDEAIYLRKQGFEVPILIMGAVRPEDAGLAADHDIRATVFSADWLEQAAPYIEKTPLHVHFKLDTGMGRLGFTDSSEIRRAEEMALALGTFNLEGVFTHFATADEQDQSYADEQHKRFIDMLSVFNSKPALIHASNSAASLLRKNSVFNAVRFGISMYGLVPSGEIRDLMPFQLRPVLSFKTTLVHVKKMKPGQKISYGATYTAEQEEWIGTLPVGYADGWTRYMQGFEVLVNGVRAEIVGRVCMDQCMIRLPYELKIGTMVTLVGKQGEEEILLDDVADYAGTIHYESACLLTARVPRVYLRNGHISSVLNGLK